MREANAYFVDLVAERRQRPTEDLLSALVQRSGDAAEDLTNEEVVATALLLFAAGFETTTNLLGNGLLALMNEPEQLRRWRNDRSLGPSAVEELLRWDSPVQLNMRTALRPATIAGEDLAPGDVVLILQGSANRDPERFDRPERFDVGRLENAPLSFGWGIHHCLGAGLARMEGEAVFDALLSRCTSVEPRFDKPEWRPTITLRGVASLPVCLSS
jgi:cytochrome P450